MKKIAACLLAGLLICLTAVGLGEEAVRHGLFDLYDIGAESAGWNGIAIPLAPGFLVTAGTAAPERAETLGLSDGSWLWDAETLVRPGERWTAFIVFDAETVAPDLSYWTLYDGALDASGLSVLTGNSSGDRLNRSVDTLANVRWQGLDCLLVTLSGDALPGSPILTEGNQLAGMILAEYAEGRNRYLALTADEIYAQALETIQLLAAEDNPLILGEDGQEGFVVTVEGNRVTFDWSGMPEEPLAEGEHLYLVVLDMGNDYLNYVEATEGMTSSSMLLAPGRTYLSGMLVSESAPVTVPTAYTVTEMPVEAEPLTEYGFQPLLTALVKAETVKDGELPEPVTSLTLEELRSGGYAFYSASTYEVTERQDETLLVTLLLPDGTCCRYESGWFYDPAYAELDAWYVSLEEAGFLDDMVMKDDLKGTCRMAYYVGGKLADEFAFEIR